MKSIHNTGTMLEVSFVLDRKDYVSPCFDEDIDNKQSTASGFHYSSYTHSDQSVRIPSLNFINKNLVVDNG